MTDSETCSLNTLGDNQVVKENAPKSKNSLIKKGFKLNFHRKNGYKSVLSKSNEDLPSQVLSLDKLENGNGDNKTEEKDSDTKPNSPIRSNALTPTSETWFNTWPERCDKIKTAESSPEKAKNPLLTNDTQCNNSNNQEPNVFTNKLTLNEALKNISLAYSPVTKKLHLIDHNDIINKESQHNKALDDIDNNIKDLVKSQSPVINSVNKLGHRRIQDGSFSSTVSTLSEPSTSGSLIDSEDRSLSNFGEDNDNGEEKSRKKSITQFFSKNVFAWKSGTTDPNGSSSVWKIFGLGATHTNTSPLHNVASSSALIQLKRPSSLPAKTFEEEQRHAQEYNEILAAAKRREAKTTAAKEKQKKLQLQLEEQQAAAAKHFTHNVIPNWSKMLKHKKTQDMWWQGLPSSVRGKVWRLAIGNDLNITPQLYEICLTRAQTRLNSPEPPVCEYENNQESSMDVIELDISRTFPHLCIFQQGGPYSEVLHSLLAAYVCFRPDVGYVQGMSYIAAILILNMEQYDAFMCFANLLNQPLHLSAFTLDQTQMNAYYNAYNQVFNNNLPKLYLHFEKSGLTPDLYLLDWIYTIFAKAMPLDVACRIWDIFLRDGYEFIFRTALGILHLYQSYLLTMDFLHGAQFLTKLPEDISADQLFKSISVVSTSIGKITFGEIVKKCSLHVSTTDLYR